MLLALFVEQSVIFQENVLKMKKDCIQMEVVAFNVVQLDIQEKNVLNIQIINSKINFKFKKKLSKLILKMNHNIEIYLFNTNFNMIIIKKSQYYKIYNFI